MPEDELRITEAITEYALQLFSKSPGLKIDDSAAPGTHTYAPMLKMKTIYP